MINNGEEFKAGLTPEQKVTHIVHDIEAAQLRKVTPEELFLKASSYLTREPSLTIPLIAALVKLPNPETAQLLTAMMVEAEEKWVIKSIKKTLYKLRQKGVKWEEKLPKDKAVLAPPKPVEPQGYLGAIDSTGSRILVITKPQPLRGLLVVFSIVDDLEGIRQFNMREFSNKGFKEFMGDSLASVDFPVVPAPGSYCVHLLKEASSLSRSLTKPLPQGYHDAEHELRGITWEDSTPLIYHEMNEYAVKDQPDLLKESAALHKIMPFSSWFLIGQELTEYVSSIKEAQKSKILLSPDQREARINSIYLQALEKLFPEEIRLLWKRRLEEMAYVLLKLGKEREANVTLSAAIDLKNPFSLLDPNPFIWNLLLKSFYSLIGEDYAQKEEEKKSSLIITP